MKKLAILCALAGAFIAAPTASAHAGEQSFTLHQVIAYIDCTATVMPGGSIAFSSADCDGVTLPTVDPLTTHSQRPVISGTFDYHNTATLRVYIAGRWFVLGQDAALVADGHLWRLDLAAAGMTLGPGRYNIVAEVITIHSQLMRDTSDSELIVAVLPISPWNDPNYTHRLTIVGSPNTGKKRIQRENMADVLILLGMLSVLLILLSHYSRKHDTSTQPTSIRED